MNNDNSERGEQRLNLPANYGGEQGANTLRNLSNIPPDVTVRGLWDRVADLEAFVGRLAKRPSADLDELSEWVIEAKRLMEPKTPG